MSPDWEIALVAGSFSLGGVLLTIGAGSVIALVRHRWDIADREQKIAAEHARELRAARMEVYPILFERLMAFEMSLEDLHHEIQHEGKTPMMRSEQMNDYWNQRSASDMETAIQRARLVAGEEVGRLISNYRLLLVSAWVDVVKGQRDVFRGDKLNKKYAELMTAAQREVRPDGKAPGIPEDMRVYTRVAPWPTRKGPTLRDAAIKAAREASAAVSPPSETTNRAASERPKTSPQAEA